MDWDTLKTGDQEAARRMAIRALRVYFAEQRWSRLAMALILLLTGVAGFGASWGMLQLGLEKMWVRYPLAVLAAWGIFLLLVWLWMQVERRWFTADEKMAELLKDRDPKVALRRLKQSDDFDPSVLEWFDYMPDFDDEGWFIGILFFVVLGVLFCAFGAIFNVLVAAPMLFAEVFVDAILIGALYKRVKPLHEQWWVIGAVRQTCRPVLMTTAALFGCALLFTWFAPEAKSVGGVIAHFRGHEVRPDPAAPLERP